MKALFLFILFSLSLIGKSQTCKPSRSFEQIPSFLSLYFGGDCLQGAFVNTTVCARFAGSQAGRLAYFAASSPTGQIGSITANPVELFPGGDSIDVVYTFVGSNVDIFCPYAFIINPLAVDWCGVNVESEGCKVAVQFATCSNQNTSHFNIQISKDLQDWKTAKSLNPISVNSSSLNVYLAQFNAPKGLQYIRIVEIDFNGNKSISEVKMISVQGCGEGGINYDILGRQVNKQEFQWLQSK